MNVTILFFGILIAFLTHCSQMGMLIQQNTHHPQAPDIIWFHLLCGLIIIILFLGSNKGANFRCMQFTTMQLCLKCLFAILLHIMCSCSISANNFSLSAEFLGISKQGLYFHCKIWEFTLFLESVLTLCSDYFHWEQNFTEKKWPRKCQCSEVPVEIQIWARHSGVFCFQIFCILPLLPLVSLVCG